MRTEIVDGFPPRSGFPDSHPAYPALDRELDLPALPRLRPFTRGLGILAEGRLHKLAPKVSVLGAIRTGPAVPRTRPPWPGLGGLDAFGPPGRLKHRSDRTTYDELRAAGLNGHAVDTVFRPFLAGVYGEDTLNTSGRFFHLTWRSFLRGGAAVPALAHAGHPTSWPQASTRTASSTVPGSLGQPGVVRLAGDERGQASAVIVATDASTAATLLLAWPNPPGTG